MFREYEQNQGILFPTYLQDWIPEDHISRVINEIVERFDISDIETKYSPDGPPAYQPVMLLKILFYGYCTSIRSSRRLAQMVITDVAAIWLAGQQKPDFRTINRFRNRFREEIANLFTQVLELCTIMGMVKLGHVALDGSKIRANASKHKAMSAGRMEKNISELQQEVNKILAQADAVDAAEDKVFGDKQGDELPDELSRKQTRLQKMESALKELKQRLEAKGKQISDKNQINFTDADSRMIITRNEGPQQCYNGQISVDDAEGVIIAQHLTNESNDKKELIPALQQIKVQCNSLPEVITADSGYFSGNNIAYLDEAGVDAYIVSTREGLSNKQKPYHKSNFKYDREEDKYICPQGFDLKFKGQYKQGERVFRIYEGISCKDCPVADKCTKSKTGIRTVTRDDQEHLREAMRTKVYCDTGQEIYRRRKAIVEPVWGQIKNVMGFRQFSFRGHDKNQAELALVCVAYNIRKVAFKVRRSPQLLQKLTNWKPLGLNLQTIKG